MIHALLLAALANDGFEPAKLTYYRNHLAEAKPPKTFRLQSFTARDPDETVRQRIFVISTRDPKVRFKLRLPRAVQSFELSEVYVSPDERTIVLDRKRWHQHNESFVYSQNGKLHFDPLFPNMHSLGRHIREKLGLPSRHKGETSEPGEVAFINVKGWQGARLLLDVEPFYPYYIKRGNESVKKYEFFRVEIDTRTGAIAPYRKLPESS